MNSRENGSEEYEAKEEFGHLKSAKLREQETGSKG